MLYTEVVQIRKGKHAGTSFREKLCKQKERHSEIEKIFGEGLKDERWFVIAQEDGRFSPAVLYSENTNIPYMLHHGICVLG